MEITRIRLYNFRNYARLDLSGFSSRVNVVYGENAQGKTNLIEAAAVAANGKSFRPGAETSLVRGGAESAYVRVEYREGGRRGSIEAAILPDGRKSYKKNGSAVRTIKEIIGTLLTVSFSPDDIRTVREGPGLRRNLLDSEISKIRPTYVDALRKYARLLAEKNKVLKKPDAPHAEELIATYNAEAAPCIRIILRNRLKYIAKLNAYVEQVHKEISGSDERIEIAYHSTLPGEDIEAELRALSHRERLAYASVAGPQRDDVIFTINGRPVKSYASQGQQRTLMLAVKIACLRILRDVSGKMPVFLLDDVLSELDEERRRNLLGSLQDLQVFITTADPRDSALIGAGSRIEVKAGAAQMADAAAT
ncbi:MAG: DNA replication/repair protein RecF [Clostridia bacterium]|nr:DNA replication/repair protein RecF [Clostridia bacterium]